MLRALSRHIHTHMHMHMCMQNVAHYFWGWVARSFGASFLRWVGCVISSQIIGNTFRCKQKGWQEVRESLAGVSQLEEGKQAANRVSSRWELVLGMTSYRCQPRHED